MSGYDLENKITITILFALTAVYLYLLLAPSQPHLPKDIFNVVIKRDSKASFDDFMKGIKDYESLGQYEIDDKYNYTNWSENAWEEQWSALRGEGGGNDQRDDFFLDPTSEGGLGGGGRGGEGGYDDDQTIEIITPSSDFLCVTGWLTIRSQVNYKYLWMHGNEQLWMGATATMDTPMHRKTFYIQPVVPHCASEGPGQNRSGWSLLREGDSKNFIQMISPNHTANSATAANASSSLDHVTTSIYSSEMWVIKLGTENIQEALHDPSYHFLLENDGYVLNREAMAFINIIPESDYPARGHSGGWNRKKPATREFGAAMHFSVVNETQVLEAIQHEIEEEKEAKEQDNQYIQLIQTYTNPLKENRVISFGLYGSKPKYTIGAIRNVELQKIYFPGWKCRFYVTSDVPKDVLDKLMELGAEIKEIPSGMGYTSGMFWRFLVASDPTVDRYIIRDSDSRLNARDRIAVEEWIQSGKSVHILRDHVNHCIVMNGGMWGGIKGAINDMEGRVKAWENRNEYMADLHFLDQYIWPDIKGHQLSHDSYCCDRYPNSKPFPTRRYSNYQHVGQVFDEYDRPRLTDIDGFIRGVPIPSSCRKQADWIYG